MRSALSMVAWRCVAVAAAVALAGCSKPDGGDEAEIPAAPVGGCGPRIVDDADTSLESLNYTVTAEGAFRVAAPFPASAGMEGQDWLESPQVPAGWAVAAIETQRGPALELRGNGTGTVTLCHPAQAGEGQECCAEGYLDARWSTVPGEPRPQAVAAFLIDGPVRLAIAYEARSSYCSRSAAFDSGVPLGRGWHDLAGADSAACS